MSYDHTSRYFKSTLISAVSIFASIAAIMAILAVIDVVTWNDVTEVLWRTAVIMLIVSALATVTGVVIDWARSSRKS